MKRGVRCAPNAAAMMSKFSEQEEEDALVDSETGLEDYDDDGNYPDE